MNNNLSLLYNSLQRKINTNSQYLCYAGVSNEVNGAVISFSYNREYWQYWKLLDCQHTSLDEIKTEQEAPSMNVGQKESPDEMESERKAPNTNIGQKTSLFHSDGEHSIDVLKVLSSLKTNQLHQRMMIL